MHQLRNHSLPYMAYKIQKIPDQAVDKRRKKVNVENWLLESAAGEGAKNLTTSYMPIWPSSQQPIIIIIIQRLSLNPPPTPREPNDFPHIPRAGQVRDQAFKAKPEPAVRGAAVATEVDIPFQRVVIESFVGDEVWIYILWGGLGGAV